MIVLSGCSVSTAAKQLSTTCVIRINNQFNVKTEVYKKILHSYHCCSHMTYTTIYVFASLCFSDPKMTIFVQVFDTGPLKMFSTDNFSDIHALIF